MTCSHCGADTTNGLDLCERCRAAVLIDLEFLPVYFRNLSRWRPSRTGGRRVPGSREPRGDTTNTTDFVSRALDEAGADLTSWANCYAEDRPQHARLVERILAMDENRCFPLLCTLFERRLVELSTLAWAGAFIGSVRYHEANLRYHTERAVPGWYAGACRRQVTMTTKCGYPTYVVPGLTWVTCGACGATTYARDHLEVILAEAREWVGRPMRIAEALVALIDTELSVPRLHKRISKWGERGQVAPIRRRDHAGDEVGPKHFRLGDVLDVLYTEGSTQIDTPNETVTAAS